MHIMTSLCIFALFFFDLDISETLTHLTFCTSRVVQIDIDALLVLDLTRHHRGDFVR